MSKIERIEQQIKSLSAKERAELRNWFDWEVWDHQVERDVQDGKLDSLADKALRDHATGKTEPL